MWAISVCLLQPVRDPGRNGAGTHRGKDGILLSEAARRRSGEDDSSVTFGYLALICCENGEHEGIMGSFPSEIESDRLIKCIGRRAGRLER